MWTHADAVIMYSVIAINYDICLVYKYNSIISFKPFAFYAILMCVLELTLNDNFGIIKSFYSVLLLIESYSNIYVNHTKIVVENLKQFSTYQELTHMLLDFNPTDWTVELDQIHCRICSHLFKV